MLQSRTLINQIVTHLLSNASGQLGGKSINAMFVVATFESNLYCRIGMNAEQYIERIRTTKNRFDQIWSKPDRCPKFLKGFSAED